MKPFIKISVAFGVVVIFGIVAWWIWPTQKNIPVTKPTSTTSTDTKKMSAPSLSTTPTTPAHVATTTDNDCSLPKQPSNILVSGRVVFPKSIAASGYAVLGVETKDGRNTQKLFPIDKDGSFCAVELKGVQQLVTVHGPNQNDFQFDIFIKSDVDLKGLIIDSKSEAVAFVFIKAFDGVLEYADARILDIIASTKEVLSFSNELNTLESLVPGDLHEGGRLFNSLIKAEDAVIKSLTTTTAVVSNGYYSADAVEGMVDSVIPLIVDGTQAVLNISPGTSANFAVTSLTEFINTTRPVGGQVVKFKFATVTVHYDKRNKLRVVDSISNIQ